MNSAILLLTVVFCVLAFLLLFLCLATRWPRWVKVLMVVVVSGFYILSWDALSNMLGWPSSAEMPRRFVLLAVVIEEPNRDRGTKGNLFVWVNSLDGGRVIAEPRAYRLPYEKDLHSLLDEAMKKARKGITQMGATEPSPEQKGGISWLRPSGNDKTKITIRDMPAAQLPEK